MSPLRTSSPFLPGMEYSFTLWARTLDAPNSLEYYASTNVMITINAPPAGGSCAVTPSTGIQSQTLFEFSCTNWHDPDGDSTGLTYNFMYNGVFLGEDFSSSSYLSSVIGRTGTDVEMVGYIRDEQGLSSCVTIPINVTARFDEEQLADEQYVEDTIQEDLDNVVAYVETGSIANTLQNALAVSEMIREVSREYDEENTTFVRRLGSYKNELIGHVE